MDRFGSLKRWEPKLFWLLVLLHLIPVLSVHWFVTLDGPCHLYNARIIHDLLLGNETTSHFFRINPFPEPNWTGHAILAISMMIVPAWIAEKILVALCVLGIAWSFRRFIRVLAPHALWTSWLVMPFLLSYVLRMGFFNYCLSWSVLFMVLTSWHAWRSSDHPKQGWSCGAWLLVLYFTHLSSLVLCVAALSIWIAVDLVQQGQWAGLAKDLRRFLLITALPIALAICYHFAHPERPETPKYLPTDQLLTWIVDGQAWIGLGSDEVWWTRITAVVFLACFLAAIVLTVRISIRKDGQPSWSWALMTLLLFVAFLVLPDQMAGGGIASPRLLMSAMFFMIPAIAVAGIPRRQAQLAIAMVILADLAHLKGQFDSASGLASEVRELMSVTATVGPDDVVLPLNYGDNWMHSNISNYIGASTGAIVLDNYAAIAAHHPVRWRPGMAPYDGVGTFATSHRPCVRMNTFKKLYGHPLDHVLTWKLHESMTDSCTNDVRAQLAGGYEEVARSSGNNAVLFTLKGTP